MTTTTATASPAASARRARKLSPPSIWFTSAPPERVPDAAHRLDQPRLAVRLGLAAEVADVDVERVRRQAEVVAPDALEDERASQDLARVPQEQLEQVEL